MTLLNKKKKIIIIITSERNNNNNVVVVLETLEQKKKNSREIGGLKRLCRLVKRLVALDRRTFCNTPGCGKSLMK